ncbi:MAG: SAM-dependent methyltransferase [Anaerolineae bacterium]|jgi:hypothetical protein
MADRSWVPEGMQFEKPSAARLYDYLLGGYHNFEADRAVADRLVQLFPEIRLAARVNRAYLRRAVTFLVEQGCEQFLDLGSGIPTVGNVHEIAQGINPSARVVYVDIDPVAVSHSQALLEGNAQAVAIEADARDPLAILERPEVRHLLDLDAPLGVLMVALLHYVLDDDVAYRLVATVRDRVAAGSYLAIAHSETRVEPEELAQDLAVTFHQASRAKDRTFDEISCFFEGWALVPPGLVHTPLWRPEGPDDLLLDEPKRALTLAGVAYKPGSGAAR